MLCVDTNFIFEIFKLISHALAQRMGKIST